MRREGRKRCLATGKRVSVIGWVDASGDASYKAIVAPRRPVFRLNRGDFGAAFGSRARKRKKGVPVLPGPPFSATSGLRASHRGHEVLAEFLQRQIQLHKVCFGACGELRGLRATDREFLKR